MTWWESFVGTLEMHIILLSLVALLVCIAGLIRALAGREHREGD